MTTDARSHGLVVELVTVGIADYPNHREMDVPEATQCCTLVKKALATYDVKAEDWSAEATAQNAKDALETRLGQWSQKRGVGSIIYWVGHGERDGTEYRALLGNVPAMALPRHYFSHIDFASYINIRMSEDDAHPDDWVLLILDTCVSGVGAWEIYRKLGELDIPRKNVGIVGTSNGAAPVRAGHFVKLFQTKIAGYTPNDDYIGMRELMRRLQDAYDVGVDERNRIHFDFTTDARIPHPSGGASIHAPQADYAELERVLRDAPDALRNHFYAKAQGTEVGQFDWHFSGRSKERKIIVDWLRSAPSGMFIVTGLPGSGKSAVLGMVLAASDPALVEALEDLGTPPILDSLCPQPRTFSAIIHLSGRTIDEAVTHLASQLNQTPTTNPEQLLTGLGGTAPITVLADALDEARDPFPIANLLRRLAGLENVKVLIGTRQSLHEAPDNATPSGRTLLDALGAPDILDPAILHLARDPEAINQYVHARLKQNFPSAMPNRNATISRLTKAITDRDQPFLFARLAVYEAIADPTWQDPSADLDALLSHGHTGIFDRAVARIRTANSRVEGLLHSLAYAQGNGYPRTGGIWVIAANALLDDTICDNDIDQALLMAAPYIMLDSEFGVSTYRLAHRTYAERYIQLDEVGQVVDS